MIVPTLEAIRFTDSHHVQMIIIENVIIIRILDNIDRVQPLQFY